MTARAPAAERAEEAEVAVAAEAATAMVAPTAARAATTETPTEPCNCPARRGAGLWLSPGSRPRVWEVAGGPAPSPRPAFRAPAPRRPIPPNARLRPA